MKIARVTGVLLLASAFALPALAVRAQPADDPQRFSDEDSNANPFGPLLPRNRPTDVHGVQAVCTGIDTDTRNDPRWMSFPAKLEFAADNGEYLAFAQVSVTDAKNQNVISVRCPGAWLLLGLSPGEYKATVSVRNEQPKTATFAVPKTGQKSVTLHFPKPADGGDVSTGNTPG